MFLELRIWEFPNPKSWNSQRTSLEFGFPVGLSCVWISLLLWNQLPKFAEQKGAPGIRIPDTPPPTMVWETISSVPPGRGCWLMGGTGGVSRKWSGGNGQVLLLGGGGLPPGRMERRGRVGWDGTGCDGKRQSTGHTPP